MLFRHLFTPLLVSAFVASSLAAEPFLEKKDLFKAGDAGFALYRIPGVVTTTKGTLLAYCEARKDAKSDWGEIEVHLKRSTDGGKTWGDAQNIAHKGTRIEGNPTKKGGSSDKEQTVNNPVAITDQSGAVHFLYCVNYARCFYMRSDDDGLTFSAPVEITSAFEAFRTKFPWTVLATGPGHGIQIKSGRLVVPIWLASGKDGAHHPSAAGTIYSDDSGATWKAGELPLPNKGDFKDPNETSAVELSDGRVMLNARSESKANRRLVTTSSDGATNWSAPKFDEALWEPICMGSIVNYPAEPGTLLFANPHMLKRDDNGEEVLGGRGERRNLSIKLSRNDGRSWVNSKTIEYAASAYSDLTVLPDKTVICFYERDNRLTAARFNLEWLQHVETVSTEPRWVDQAAKDALQDRLAVPYDGFTPNKMVCDTTLRELPDGSWILLMLAGGDFEPSPENYTGVTRSYDKGRTWTKLEPLDTGFPRSGKTIGQGPTELMVRDGRATLFFSTHSKTWGLDWKSWMMHSDDSCKTWSKPEPVPGRLANFTFIRNHTMTSDGRILLPFQHYVGPGPDVPPPDMNEPSPWHKILFHYVSNPRNGVLMSSDGGKSWTEHGDIRVTDDDRYHGWAENNIVDLGNNRVGMIIRGDKLGGVLYYAESTDGGRTWPAKAQKTDIPNPGSKATLYPLGKGAVAMLHNPNPKLRSPMALWISFDGLKTWPYRRVLIPESTDGTKKWLNYPDGFVSKDKQWLHFAFDDARHRAVYYGAKLPPIP